MLQAEKMLLSSVALLLFAAPFILLPSLYEFSSHPKTAFIQIWLCLILLLFWYKALSNRKITAPRGGMNWVVVSFLFWSLISITWAVNPYESFSVFLHWALCAVLFFIAAGNFKNADDLKILFAALAFSGTVVSLIGLSQHFFHISIIPQAAPPASTFSNRNLSAQFINMILPSYAFFLFTSRLRRIRIFTGIGLLISIMYLAASQTRTAWLAAIVQFCIIAVLFLYFFERGPVLKKLISAIPGPRLILAACVAMMLITAALSGILQGGLGWKKAAGFFENFQHKVIVPVNNRYEIVAEDSMSVRLALWRNTFEMSKDQPLTGVGLGNFRVVYPLYYRRATQDQLFSEIFQARYAHNDFIQMAAELGVTGLFLFFLMCFYPVFKSLRRLSKQSRRQVKITVICINAGIAGFVMNAMFSFPMQVSIPPAFLFLYIGMLSGMSHDSRSGETVQFPMSKHAGVLLCVATIILAAALGWRHTNILISGHDYNSALEKEHSNDPAGALKDGLEALSRNQHFVEAHCLVGRAFSLTGNQKKAVGHLQHALDLRPYDINTMLNIGIAYFRNGDSEKAIENLERVLTIRPGYVKALANLGMMYIQTGDNDRALQCFRRTLIHDPENISALIHAGTLLAGKERFQEAAEAYETALELNPELILLHRDLAVIYYQRLRQIEQARPHMRIYAENAPDDPVSKEFLKIITP